MRVEETDLKVLRIVRGESGMTLGELAEKSGIALNTISRIERGVQEPRANTLHKLAEALGMDVAELLDVAESPKVPRPLSVEWALKTSRDKFSREIKTADTVRLYKLLSELVGDDYAQTLEDARAGRRERISQEAFSRALEVRAELIERGEDPPEKKLPAFKARLEALHLV